MGITKITRIAGITVYFMLVAQQLFAQTGKDGSTGTCHQFHFSYVSRKIDQRTMENIPVADFSFTGNTMPDIIIQGDSVRRNNTLTTIHSMGYIQSATMVFSDNLTNDYISANSKSSHKELPWQKTDRYCEASSEIDAPKYLHSIFAGTGEESLEELTVSFYDSAIVYYSGIWTGVNTKKFSVSGPIDMELHASSGKVGLLDIFCKKISIPEFYCDTLAIENTLVAELGAEVRKKISLANVKVEGGPIKLYTNRKEAGTVMLSFKKTDIRDFIFDYQYFELDSAASETEYESYLNSVLDVQLKNGFSQGKIKADKELKQLHYNMNGQTFINWLDKNWWDYGYNKGLIFRNALLLMLFFYLINMIFYKRLLHETYVIDEFVSNDKTIDSRFKKSPFLRILYKGIYGALYTGFIFWGVKLDLHKIRFHWILPALYIILQYLVGIICLAYLANYIISK